MENVLIAQDWEQNEKPMETKSTHDLIIYIKMVISGEQFCGENQVWICSVQTRKGWLNTLTKWRGQSWCAPMCKRPGLPPLRSASLLSTLGIPAHWKRQEESYLKAPGLVLPRPRTRDSVTSMLSERIIGTMCLNKDEGDGMPIIWEKKNQNCHLLTIRWSTK